jgi:hypothetical protein
MKLLLGLLLAGTISFSLYLTPSPFSRRSPLHFIQFFLLIAISVVGLCMTLPFFFDWRLPLQQGLGSNQEMLLRGALLSGAALFAVTARKVDRGAGPVWISALALMAAGIPEMVRALGLLNDTVNGMLAYGGAPMNWMLKMMWPYLVLLGASAGAACVGALSLFSGTIALFRQEWRNTRRRGRP